MLRLTFEVSLPPDGTIVFTKRFLESDPEPIAISKLGVAGKVNSCRVSIFQLNDLTRSEAIGHDHCLCPTTGQLPTDLRTSRELCPSRLLEDGGNDVLAGGCIGTNKDGSLDRFESWGYIGHARRRIGAHFEHAKGMVFFA